jgi:mRNA-degrading endonuclease RelE of RelBE toxin-antitoxin system
MFRIAFTPSALADIQWFRKYEQKIIFDKIEEQLTHQPNVETRNRKPLRPNQVAEWELRIGKYRVFSDADTDRNAGEVKLVGSKEGHKLLVRDKEYEL